MHLTAKDRRFLKACGIAAEPMPECDVDGTETLLRELGIPATRENYLRLAFGGNPPADGVLDGEIEAELPEKFQDEEEDA